MPHLFRGGRAMNNVIVDQALAPAVHHFHPPIPSPCIPCGCNPPLTTRSPSIAPAPITPDVLMLKAGPAGRRLVLRRSADGIRKCFRKCHYMTLCEKEIFKTKP